jgi:hypothetical protein
MAFQDPIAGIVGMFGDTKYETLYNDNEALRPALVDSVRQLGIDRNADQRTVDQIQGEVANAQDLYRQITPEDLSVLGQIARNSAVNPLDNFDALSSRYSNLANSFADRMAGAGLGAVDKLNLSRTGFGGRGGGGRSRFETILSTNRSNQAALPLFQTALSSISPATSALSNSTAQQANTAMQAIAARGNLPLRGVGLSFLPMQARGEAAQRNAALLGSLTNTNQANIMGYKAHDNWAKKLSDYGNQQAGQIMDLAKTAASMYFGGGLGGAAGALGGGGGGGGGGFSQIFGLLNQGQGQGGQGQVSNNVYNPQFGSYQQSPYAIGNPGTVSYGGGSQPLIPPRQNNPYAIGGNFGVSYGG